MDWELVKNVLQISAFGFTALWFIVKQAMELGERRATDKQTTTDVAALIKVVREHTESDNERFANVQHMLSELTIKIDHMRSEE